VSLPWVRLDSNIAHHDKVLWLISQPNGYRAFSVYIFGLGYSGGQGTDGHIPPHALPSIHGTEKLAQMLVESRLWTFHETGDGYRIHNYSDRQELALISESKRAAQRLSARRTNCKRYHGTGCECWKNDGTGTVTPIGKAR